MLAGYVCPRANGAWLVRIALAGLAATLMAAPAEAQNNGTVAGVVQARESGQPVADAAVMVEGASVATTTTGVGRFRLVSVPAGRVALIIRAPGFAEFRVAEVQVQAGATSLVTIDLELTPNFMERVQVTATKEELSIGEVAAQTDIVDQAVMESRGDQTLVQAIAHVPGVIVSTQLGIFESVMMRGMPRGGQEFTNTLLLIDGVPQMSSFNAARAVGVTINDASSIEIVRGPNSALYGRTAIGGSINLRTADPTPTRQFGVEFTGGEFGTVKGVAKASGPIKERAGYYVSVGKERYTGFYDTKTGGDFEQGNTALLGKLTFAPDNRSFGSISFNRVDSSNSTPTNEPIIDGQLLHERVPEFSRFTNFNIPGPNYDHVDTRLTLNYMRQLAPWAKIVETFGYRKQDQAFIDDGDFIGGPFDFENHTLEMYPFSQALREDHVYQELRLDLRPMAGAVTQSLLIGGSYEKTNGTLDTDFIYTDEENFGFVIDYLNPVIPPKDEWQHDVQPRRTFNVGITGLFAQYTIEPTPRWVFTAGGRYDRLALTNTREGIGTFEDSFQAFSPKASATFKAIGAGGGSPTTLNLYGAYSRAFLPPRPPSGLSPSNVTLELKPEHIDNIEGGLKGSALGGRVSFEGTYFWMKEDGVVLNRRQGPFFFPTNAGVQQYKGFETGMSVALNPKVSMYANAAVYRARFGEFVIQSEDSDDEVLTGNRLPISPDYLVNWGLSLAPVPAIEATVNVKHVSSVQADRENTFALKPYSLVDAAVTWRRGPLRVTISARNLLDKEYYWNADGEVADPGRPRQVLVTTSVLFR